MWCGVRTNEDEAAARAKAWVQTGTDPLAFLARLEGLDEPMWVNSMLCAYPGMGVAVVQCRESPFTLTTIPEAYARIKDLVVPPVSLRGQRQIWEAAKATSQALPQSPQERWQSAVGKAEALGVPVACIIFATAQKGDHPITLLQAVVAAPLDVALSQLQQSARLIASLR